MESMRRVSRRSESVLVVGAVHAPRRRSYGRIVVRIGGGVPHCVGEPLRKAHATGGSPGRLWRRRIKRWPLPRRHVLDHDRSRVGVEPGWRGSDAGCRVHRMSGTIPCQRTRWRSKRIYEVGGQSAKGMRGQPRPRPLQSRAAPHAARRLALTVSAWRPTAAPAVPRRCGPHAAH